MSEKIIVNTEILFENMYDEMRVERDKLKNAIDAVLERCEMHIASGRGDNDYICGRYESHHSIRGIILKYL